MTPLRSTRLAIIAAALALGPTVTASAQTISSRSESTPYPGLRVVTGRTTSPTTTFHAAMVSLCTDYVHVTADVPTATLRRTSAWASARGVQLATNGDFFATAGPRVYGFAVGDGHPWPIAHTGTDPAVASEWYYRRYGWF
ncbi:MAG: hypothetical protein WCJ30_14940, partial [Deltaproteobacteria bacterium]